MSCENIAKDVVLLKMNSLHIVASAVHTTGESNAANTASL